jgi:hypothetical protein
VPLDARQFEYRLETGEADLAFGAFPKAARNLRRQRLYFDGYSSETPVPLPSIEIAQFWHERFHRDAGHKWLRNLTFELFARAVR